MNIRLTALGIALACSIACFASAPASANEVVIYNNNGVPIYQHWQPAWDRYEYDRNHVILGTVAGFQPYRLQVQRQNNGHVIMIDLKNGTVILPTGATPMPNERVAVVGYWSHGTFIANRVLIRG